MISAESYLLIANMACAIGTFVVGLVFIMTPFKWAQFVAMCSYLLIIPTNGVMLYRLWSWKSIELPDEDKDTSSVGFCHRAKAAYHQIRYFIMEQPDQYAHPFYCFLSLISLFAVEFMMFQYAREAYYLIESAWEVGNTDVLVQQAFLGSVCVVAYFAAILAYEYEIIQLYHQKKESSVLTEEA